jgi:hypothetical protein
MAAAGALQLGYDVAQGPTDGAHNRLKDAIRDRRPERSTLEEVAVDGRDLFTKEYAVVAEAAGAGWDRHAGRPWAAHRKYRYHQEIIGESVPDILGDHQRRPGLMGVIGLTGREDEPDLAPARRARKQGS